MERENYEQDDNTEEGPCEDYCDCPLPNQLIFDKSFNLLNKCCSSKGPINLFNDKTCKRTCTSCKKQIRPKNGKSVREHLRIPYSRKRRDSGVEDGNDTGRYDADDLKSRDCENIRNSKVTWDSNDIDNKQISSRYCASENENEWSCTNWCEYVIVIMLTAVLLIAALALTIFWVMYYREGFSWDQNPKLQFNLHPVLMVAGFIFFSGYSILFYRICRCFRRIYVKLFHTIFHAIAIPCIVVGFLAVFEYHNNSSPPIPNFYSIHSWLGCITMGLFAIQFVFGFFFFLILLCCEGPTACFRASLVPIHSAFGLCTFMLAIATCLTGLTERTITLFGENYAKGTQEGLVLNVLAVVLVALGILVSFTVRSTADRPDDSSVFHSSKMSKVMSAGSRASAGPY